MCQYSCTDGLANDWHLVHLGSRAVGGAALVMVEASAVTPEGRISPQDMGIWSDAHTRGTGTDCRFHQDQWRGTGDSIGARRAQGLDRGTVAGGAALSPEQGGWPVLAPSALAFSDASPHPAALDRVQIEQLVADFVAAAQRSLEAGFEVIELHFAHGYLLHEFLSPLSNSRTDDYGGSLENRARFPLEVARAVRAVWPQTLPVFVRLSTTDWAEGGWDLAQSIQLCALAQGHRHRPDRLLQRRTGTTRAHPGGAGVPDPKCHSDPQRSRDAGRCSRADNLTGASRADRRNRSGRRGAAGA